MYMQYGYSFAICLVDCFYNFRFLFTQYKAPTQREGLPCSVCTYMCMHVIADLHLYYYVSCIFFIILNYYVKQNISVNYSLVHSTKPQPKEKDYVVAFIGKNRWRLPGGDKAAPSSSSSEDRGKTEEELQLDREAAEAVLKGKGCLYTSVLAMPLQRGTDHCRMEIFVEKRKKIWFCTCGLLKWIVILQCLYWIWCSCNQINNLCFHDDTGSH